MASRSEREPRAVLVSTGATDLAGLGLTVSHRLLERDPTVAVTRVVGPPISLADGAWPREHLLVAPPDLAGSLRTATIYAGAAGTTAVQAACIGCPSVISGRGEQPGSPGGSPRCRRMRGRGGPDGHRRGVSRAP